MVAKNIANNIRMGRMDAKKVEMYFISKTSKASDNN
jgi:hypothetical protein